MADASAVAAANRVEYQMAWRRYGPTLNHQWFNVMCLLDAAHGIIPAKNNNMKLESDLQTSILSDNKHWLHYVHT